MRRVLPVFFVLVGCSSMPTPHPDAQSSPDTQQTTADTAEVSDTIEDTFTVDAPDAIAPLDANVEDTNVIDVQISEQSNIDVTSEIADVTPPRDVVVPPADAPREASAPDGTVPDVSMLDANTTDAPNVLPDGAMARCPADMQLVGNACVDRYEAPNVAGGLALVMYTFDESEAWCRARGKRLCFDDEWAAACGGPNNWRYPYGNTFRLGVCNDEETYRAYSQTLLNQWPSAASSPTINTLADLFTRVRLTAAPTADHVQALYQGEPSGSNTGCTNAYGVFDTLGNIEEWTRRRDGGMTSFHGKLKGRYWGNERVGPNARDTTCQGGVTSHGDGFRFYEIGFRCCRDALP